MEVAELPNDRTEFVAAVSAWTETRDKAVVTRLLQDAGVPAGPMNRAVDVLADPQLGFRRLYTEHGPSAVRRTDALRDTVPHRIATFRTAELRPAPMPGEHTREICHKVLGMAVEEIDRLIAEGVLFSWSP